jgi:hypothetical protein
MTKELPGAPSRAEARFKTQKATEVAKGVIDRSSDDAKEDELGCARAFSEGSSGGGARPLMRRASSDAPGVRLRKGSTGKAGIGPGQAISRGSAVPIVACKPVVDLPLSIVAGNTVALLDTAG